MSLLAMASPSPLSFPAFFLALSLLALLISPTYSLNCTSQKLTNNKLYANCTDLPTLNAYLHYTYNSSNSSLSIAFIAPPAKSDGWVGWGINPNGTGMAGAQALIALKSGGSLGVKTFNLVSYGEIKEEKLSFDVWDVSAVSDGGNFTIYASVKVPEKAETVNQIWQVGTSVSGGKPDKHELAPANKDAKATLELMSTGPSGGNTTITPPTSSPTTNTSTGANSTGGGYTVRELNVAVYFGLFVLLANFIGF